MQHADRGKTACFRRSSARVSRSGRMVKLWQCVVVQSTTTAGRMNIAFHLQMTQRTLEAPPATFSRLGKLDGFLPANLNYAHLPVSVTVRKACDTAQRSDSAIQLVDITVVRRLWTWGVRGEVVVATLHYHSTCACTNARPNSVLMV